MAFDIAVLVDIAIILFTAKIFGEVAERLKFPGLLGELIGGLLIGSLLIVKPTDFMNEIGSFGILFLFFMLGLTLRVADVRKDFRPSFLITIGGTVVSFFIGFLFGYFLFADALKGLFVGVAVMSTSTAIALRLLHDAGELNTKIFNIANTVSRIDDVLTILMITVLTSIMLAGFRGETVLIAVSTVLVIFVIVEKWLANAIGRGLPLFKHLRDEHILIAIALVAVFVVSFLAEQIAIGGAIGAFIVGQAMSRSKLTEEELIPKMKTIAYGFFVPVFFVYAAISADLGLILGSLGAIVVLFVAAVIAKFAGTALFAWREGHKGRELFMLGSSMIPRGEYTIAIAYIALFSQFIDRQLYSIIIAFVILSIVVTPLIFHVLKKKAV